MRYENSPYGQLYMHSFEKMFEGTPYEIPVIGSIKDINGVTRDDIFKYFKDYYAPNNAVLAIAGDIDFEETMKLVKTHFNSIPATPNAVSTKPTEYKWSEPKVSDFHLKGNSANPLVNYSYAAPSISDRKSRVLDLLASVLGGGKSSYFFQKYVSAKNPVMTQFYASNYSLMHTGVFFFGGELLPKISEKAFRERFQKDLQEACYKAVSEESLERIKKQITISFYRKLERNHSLASMVAEREIFHSDYKFYNEELRDYAQIGVDEVRNSCFGLVTAKKKVFTSLKQ